MKFLWHLFMLGIVMYQAEAMSGYQNMMSISTYFDNLKDSDIVFAIDVSDRGSNKYIDLFKVLAQDSRTCIKKLKKLNNDIALITFGNSSKVEFSFSGCYTESCLSSVAENVTTKNETRSLFQSLRHAKKLLKDKRSEYEVVNGNSTYTRKQSIVLLTFGIGMDKNPLNIGQRILRSGIDLVLFGLGEEAFEHRQYLYCIAHIGKHGSCENNIKIRKKPSIQFDGKESSKSKNKRSKRNRHIKEGTGYSYISQYVEYVVDMISLAISYTC